MQSRRFPLKDRGQRIVMIGARKSPGIRSMSALRLRWNLGLVRVVFISNVILISSFLRYASARFLIQPFPLQAAAVFAFQR